MKRSILILFIALTLSSLVLAQASGVPEDLVDLPLVPQDDQLWSAQQQTLIEAKTISNINHIRHPSLPHQPN